MTAHTDLPTDIDAPAPRKRRGVSGTTFVIACAVFAVAFVLFLVFVSPLLLDRTLSLAPPPAPQPVGSGQTGGQTWSATAFDRNEGVAELDERGVEPVEEPEPCLRVDVAGEPAGETCVLRRGGALRTVEAAVVAADGTALVYGVVAPTVTVVELAPAEGDPLRVTPSYVDFGFPLGFFVVEVEPGTAITEIRAVDRDGSLRGTATCTTQPSPLGECTITEADR
jgi:hypothetical protein